MTKEEIAQCICFSHPPLGVHKLTVKKDCPVHGTPAHDWREEFDKKFPQFTIYPDSFNVPFETDPKNRKKIIDFIQNLLDQHTAHLVERIKNELGDFAHQHYLGCSMENGKWHYSYDTEIIYIIEKYFQAIDIVKDNK